jgi:hypothetical protein
MRAQAHVQHYQSNMLYVQYSFQKPCRWYVQREDIAPEHTYKIGLSREEGCEYWRKKSWMILFLGL